MRGIGDSKTVLRKKRLSEAMEKLSNQRNVAQQRALRLRRPFEKHKAKANILQKANTNSSNAMQRTTTASAAPETSNVGQTDASDPVTIINNLCDHTGI